METIGFKNFRKFRELPETRLAPITFLVGANNSGKSTLVKGALLMYNFLQTMTSDVSLESTPDLLFDVTTPFDIHVGTQGRAKNQTAPEEEGMSFILGFCDIVYRITTIGGNQDMDKSFSKVAVLDIEDRKNGLRLSINFQNATTKVLLPRKDEIFVDAKELKEIEEKLSILTKERDKLSQSPTGNLSHLAELSEQIEIINKKLSAYKKFSETSEQQELNLPLSVHRDKINEFYILAVIRGILTYTETQSDKDKRTSGYKEDVTKKNTLRSYYSIISDTITRISASLHKKAIEYIFAHVASQNLFYNSKDKNDYIADTIHKYLVSKINEGDEFQSFIIDWMGKDNLNIGTNFHIISHGGEAYELEITNFNNNRIPLADNGMGTCQLMVLLLKVATIAKKYKGFGVCPTVFIEEPEQNLHPRLQSKLVDLWSDIYKRFGTRFIIETHSEYIIRKTQSIVARQSCKSKDELNKKNPFLVYYFPEESTPYDMEYREDGKFANDFGPGFYDVSSELFFDII